MNEQDARAHPSGSPGGTLGQARGGPDQTPRDQAPRDQAPGRPEEGQHLWAAGRGAPPHPLHGFETPEPEHVLELIRRAEQHELGSDFLAKGAPDAVAATFGVHAFLVDAARDHLASRQAD